jgi:ribosomal protein S12 methylthiotransferase
MVQEPVGICFVTLGCPKNEVDSDVMAAAVEGSAYSVVRAVEDATVVVLNTCAFIQEATEESIATALELANGWRADSSDRRLVVAGCMVSRYGTDLESSLTEADAFMSVADEAELLDTVARLTGVPAMPGECPPRTAPGPSAYLRVSDGCDRRCAYCTIPAIRGPHRSRSTDDILAEARHLIDAGARELILVGQDVSAYGRDLDGDADLAGLVERLAALPGDWRLRLMYLQPDGVTDRLLEVMSASARVCRYLDIPLQHASASVLRRMGRPGDTESHLALVARIKAAMPGAVIRTTLMTGFPGETDDDADELERFVAEAELDFVGVFTYSAEEGTRAAEMETQVPSSIATERAQALRDLADEIGFVRAESSVGETLRVLVEGEEEGETVGRTCGQAPDIDGQTVIEGVARPGTFVDVRVTSAVGYDLVGEVLC